MNVRKTLQDAAQSMGSIYKIAFTAVLLVELVRMRFKARRLNEVRTSDPSHAAPRSRRKVDL